MVLQRIDAFRDKLARALRPPPGQATAGLPRRQRIDTRQGVALYVESVTVSFDGFKALDNLTLYLNEGELRCIIGPNGAGKTTLMDVITGKTRPDSGSVFFGSLLDLTKLSEPEIAQAGIGRKFQRPTVYPAHTVWENLELAIAGRRRVRDTLLARLSPEQSDTIRETLATIHLSDAWHEAAGRLSHGQKQWLEIGMLLVQEPSLLLVDEPVAGMNQQEMEMTAELLTALAGDRTVVVVEHDMDFIRNLAQKVTVLHEGRVLSEGDMETIQNDPAVIEVYLGA